MRLNRRCVLLGAVGLSVAACAKSNPPNSTGTHTVKRMTYGEDPSQFGDLYLPREAGVVLPVAVIIHGGFWRTGYGLDLGASLSQDLADQGVATWNLEYRRVGGTGGWPQTFDDITAGIDHLATIDGLDLDRVVGVGHSAGGHLAVWAAGVPSQVRLSGVVSQAGVLDLRAAVANGVGGSAVSDLMGGSPDDVPERYDDASPIEQVPLGIPVRCVHGTRDGNVPINQSERYVAAATDAGDDATLASFEGDHFALIDVGSEAWATCRKLTLDLLAR